MRFSIKVFGLAFYKKQVGLGKAQGLDLMSFLGKAQGLDLAFLSSERRRCNEFIFAVGGNAKG